MFEVSMGFASEGSLEFASEGSLELAAKVILRFAIASVILQSVLDPWYCRLERALRIQDS